MSVPNPNETVPLTPESQAEFASWFDEIERAQRIARDPWAEIRRLTERQCPLEEVVEMFKFYLRARPGTILLQTAAGVLDIREWVERKLAEHRAPDEEA